MPPANPDDPDTIRKIYPGGEIHSRLDRIERRLDQISIFLERLTRVEERQLNYDSSFHDGMTRLQKGLDEHTDRIKKLELNDANSAQVLQWTQSVFWAVIAGALALLAHHFLGPLMGVH